MKRVIFFLILMTVNLATVEAKAPWIRSSQVGNASSLISEWLQQINFMDNFKRYEDTGIGWLEHHHLQTE